MFQPLEDPLGRSWKHLEFLKRHPEGPWALQGGKCVSKRAPKAAQEGPGWIFQVIWEGGISELVLASLLGGVQGWIWEALGSI